MTTGAPSQFLGRAGRWLLRGCAAPPGTGPQGETCGTCKWREQKYDPYRKRRVSMCALVIRPDRRSIETNFSACSRWQPDADRRAELDHEEVTTMASADDVG